MARRTVTVDPAFGRRLRELRTLRGLSLRDLAEAGISKSYVSELENSKKRATPEIAAALDRILCCDGALAALVQVSASGSNGHAAVDSQTHDEHRRLLVAGAWFSLLGATLQIDLDERVAAGARLLTAASLARQAEHDEIHAWCYETRAWDALTAGNYRQALDLSRTAQQIAP